MHVVIIREKMLVFMKYKWTVDDYKLYKSGFWLDTREYDLRERKKTGTHVCFDIFVNLFMIYNLCLIEIECHQLEISLYLRNLNAFVSQKTPIDIVDFLFSRIENINKRNL